MFEAGIIIFMLGCVIRIWLRLSAHSETRAMAPQRVGERLCAIKVMRHKMRLASYESTIFISIGLVMILIFGVFN